MNETQKKIVREFGEIAGEKGFNETVIFAVGAIAFGKGVSDERSIVIMQDMIDFAKESKDEDDFSRKVSKKYLNN